MRIWPYNQLKILLLLLAFALASEAQAEPVQRKSLDRNHLLGDFGPHPYPPGSGRPRDAWEFSYFKREWVKQWPNAPMGLNQSSPAQLNKNLKMPVTTDLNHLRKTKDGKWIFNSTEDANLFLHLPKEKVKTLLGVPRKDTSGFVEYNCRLNDSLGYLELFIGDEVVQSSRIWLDGTLRPPEWRK